MGGRSESASGLAKPIGRTSWSRASAKMIRCGDFESIGQRDRAVGKLGTKRHHLLADPRQAEVGDLQDAVLGDKQIAGLDVAMAAQPLPRGVLHSLAELDAKPQRLDKVEPAATDPANQVPALNQLHNNVRLTLDDLDRVRLDDVRMSTELHPEPALGGKPRPPDLVTQQFVLQGLECDHRPTGFAQVVVDHVDQAHSTFVHVEDLEPVTDPVAHTPDAHHGEYPIPGSHQRARNHRACRHHYTPDPALGSDIRQVL